MAYFEATIAEPKNPEKPEEGMQQMDIQVNVNQVMCIIKPALQQPVVCMMTVNLMLVSVVPKEIDGLHVVETKEGGTAWINPDLVLFYYSPEIGIYVLCYPGGSRVAIRATGAEVRSMLEGGGNVIV